MVAFLQKSTGSEEFHQIVDFLADSHISMLLGDISISNADGISSCPILEIFKQLTQWYVSKDDKLTFQKGEGPLSPGRTQHTSTLIETSPQLQNIPNTNRKTRTRTRRMGIRIPQSDVPSSVADEAQLLRPKPRQAASGQVLKNYQRLSRRLPYQGYPVQARPERVSNLPNEPPLREALITLTKRLKKLEKQLKHKRRRIVIDSSEDEGLSLDAKKDSHQTHRFSDKLNAKQVEAQWIADEERILQEVKQIDKSEKVINWNDPDVLRYHAVQNRPLSKAEVRKNMCTYLKNRGGYKMSHFKGMSYEDIRPIFERVSKKTGGSRKKTLARKREGENKSKEGAKRQKTEYEKEKEELKAIWIWFQEKNLL
ncbi:hypothetical protein Tco_0657456 [Tanacetum coccineum]|uniref:Uncharacterized protein n=1 Tax=Tanacetum coccineum TaxID=301880 RepID=A0ABQ4XBL5_9ASTR